MASKNLTFEESMQRLEQIVTQLKRRWTNRWRCLKRA